MSVKPSALLGLVQSSGTKIVTFAYRQPQFAFAGTRSIWEASSTLIHSAHFYRSISLLCPTKLSENLCSWFTLYRFFRSCQALESQSSETFGICYSLADGVHSTAFVLLVKCYLNRLGRLELDLTLHILQLSCCLSSGLFHLVRLPALQPDYLT